FFLEQSIGDDLVLCWRGDDEFARSLVVGMIDRRQPLARAVRPVLAEEGPLAKLVRDDAQTIARNAVVAYAKHTLRAGARRCRKCDVQPIVLMHVLKRRAVLCDGGFTHS